jgi:hypothetical protein
MTHRDFNYNIIGIIRKILGNEFNDTKKDHQ